MENIMFLRMENGRLRATDGKRMYFPNRSMTDIKEGFIKNIKVTLDKGTYAFIEFEYVTFEGVSDENIEDALQFRPEFNTLSGVVNCIPVFLNYHYRRGYRLIIGNGNKMEEVYTNSEVGVYYEDKNEYFRAVSLTEEIKYVKGNMLSDYSGDGYMDCTEVWEKIKLRGFELMSVNADIINVEDGNTLLRIAKEVDNWREVHVRILDDKIIAVDNPVDYTKRYYIIKNGETLNWEGDESKFKKVMDISSAVLKFVEDNGIATRNIWKGNQDMIGTMLYNDTLRAFSSGALIPNKLRAFNTDFIVWTHYLYNIHEWSEVKDDVKKLVNESVAAFEKEVKAVGKKVGAGSIDELNKLNWKRRLVRW